MNFEKTKNALLYFAESSSELSITKAMKLLFHADSQSVIQSGASITGLDYHAWDHGPVPPKVHRALDRNRFDFIELLRTERGHFLRPLSTASLDVFSAEERAVLEATVRWGASESATNLSDLSHQELPWLKTELYGKIDSRWAIEQATRAGAPVDDQEIILDVIERNPELHHFYHSSLNDWLATTSQEDTDELLDEHEMTPVEWIKGVGWVSK